MSIYLSPISLLLCLTEINLHWFQYFSCFIPVLHMKTWENWKNIRETILVKSYNSLVAFSPWIWILIDFTNSFLLHWQSTQFSKRNIYWNIRTLRKPGWIVVDISECDIYCCWAWQPSNLPSHIFGLNDNGIMLSGFPVHVMQGSPDDSCGGKKTNKRKKNED